MGEKEIKILVLLSAAVFFFLLILPSLQAISLSGQRLSPIIYKPGVYFTNHYEIRETSLPVEVLLSKGPFRSVAVTEVVNNGFDLIVDFPPQEGIEPGSYSIGLSVREKLPEGDSGIASLVGVSKNIEVIVYAYDKDVKVALSVPSRNEGENLTVSLGVESVGYINISEVFGKVHFFSQRGEKMAEWITEKKSLPSLQSVTFVEQLESAQWPSGAYHAEAMVFYDGKQEQKNVSFLIGQKDVLLKNYTRPWEQGFTMFSAEVANGWGNPLQNVYAKIFIEGKELLHTPSISLDAWEEGVLQGIMEVTLDAKAYPGEMELFFDGESKKLPLLIEVGAKKIAPPIQQQTTQELPSFFPFFPYLLGVSAVIIVVLLLLLLRRGEKSEF